MFPDYWLTPSLKYEWGSRQQWCQFLIGDSNGWIGQYILGQIQWIVKYIREMMGSISCAWVATCEAQTCPVWISNEVTSSHRGGKARQKDTKHGNVGMKKANRLAWVSTVQKIKWLLTLQSLFSVVTNFKLTMAENAGSAQWVRHHPCKEIKANLGSWNLKTDLYWTCKIQFF